MDGGHTADCTLNDLKIADAILTEIIRNGVMWCNTHNQAFAGCNKTTLPFGGLTALAPTFLERQCIEVARRRHLRRLEGQAILSSRGAR